MLLAAFIIGALLGSASVAQAGRKCVNCFAFTETDDCYQDDVSEFLPDAPEFDADQSHPNNITIAECAADEKCLYYTFNRHSSRSFGQLVGRLCANEAKRRLISRQFFSNMNVDTRTCFNICDTDLCNASGYKEEAVCDSFFSEYPCGDGFRHGCEDGYCWSQCSLGIVQYNWCWTWDDQNDDWQTCKTNKDCTLKQAYKKSCGSTCSAG